MSAVLDTTSRSLRRIALAKQREGRVPGLYAGVCRRGDLVWGDGIGVADVEAERAPGPDDQFLIASNTKTFTAVMVFPLRVIWTCTGPHCVSTADPVTVDDDDLDDPDEDEPDEPDDDEPEPDEPEPEPLPPVPLPAAVEDDPVLVFDVPPAPDTTALGELVPAANELEVEVW